MAGVSLEAAPGGVSRPPDDGHGRELAPDFSLAEDTKIGFVVSVLALLVLFLSVELARWPIGWLERG